MKTLLDNKGLQALTLPIEQEEIQMVAIKVQHSVESIINAAQVRRRRIVFAFFQSDFQGGRIPYWHVTLPYHKCFKSTLSMEGLRQWRVL